MATDTSTRSPTTKFNLTPSQAEQLGKDFANVIRGTVKRIKQDVTKENATFENVLEPFAQAFNTQDRPCQILGLLQNTSTNAELRKSCSEAFSSVNQIYNEVYADAEFFTLVDAVQQKNKDTNLSEEKRRLLDDLYHSCIGTGAGLEGSIRERYLEVAKRSIELRTAFMDNLGKPVGTVSKTAEELEGVSKATLDSLEKDEDGKLKISLRGPGFNAIMENCSNSATRDQLYVKAQDPCPENAIIFTELVTLRDEAARLLGFSSFAQKITRRRLAKSPERVMALLDEMQENLIPMVEKELVVMKKFANTDQINIWDFNYYHKQMMKEKSVDDEAIAEFFPTDYTVPQMMVAFEQLFGLVIKQVKDVAADEVWHPDVTMFAVWDGKESCETFIGYLYLDVYPRDHKYSHAANFNIGVSYIDMDDRYHEVATALICNVTPPSGDRPSLLKHSQVVTLFHELGHGMHDLLGKSRYSSLSGHRTVRDFTESPSQLLEYWCWTPDILSTMSCHYSYLSDTCKTEWQKGQENNTPQPPKQIPEQLIKNLVASKNVNRGIRQSRQVAFSLFDMTIYHPSSHEAVKAMDIGKIYNDIHLQCLQMTGPVDRKSIGNPHVTTNHYVWGTEANYYSYVQTLAFAADMWKTCFEKNPMDPVAARRYRKIILDHGASRDESKALEELLGREPSTKAFFEEIGA